MTEPEVENGPHNLKRVVASAISRKASEDYLFELLEDELSQLCNRNREKLASRNEVYRVYEMMRSSMTPQERDELFLALLDSVKEISNEGRRNLRSIISEHLRKLDYVKKVYMEKLDESIRNY